MKGRPSKTYRSSRRRFYKIRIWEFESIPEAVKVLGGEDTALSFLNHAFRLLQYVHHKRSLNYRNRIAKKADILEHAKEGIF